MKKLFLFGCLGLLFFIGLFLWAIYTYVPPLIERVDSRFFVDKEEKLGRALVEQMESSGQVRFTANPKMTEALNVISSRLLSNISVTKYHYNIKVIQGEEVNAFTLPGANIFVYEGLIKFSRQPEEVAAVLAHEIGHAEEKHVVKKMAKEIGIGLIFYLFTGGDLGIVGEVARAATSTVFDRGQEEAADEYALRLLENSHIDPKSLAMFFQRLNETSGDYNEVMELLATHPNHASRIEAALNYKPAADFRAEKFKLNWEEVKK